MQTPCTQAQLCLLSPSLPLHTPSHLAAVPAASQGAMLFHHSVFHTEVPYQKEMLPSLSQAMQVPRAHQAPSLPGLGTCISFGRIKVGYIPKQG